MHGYYFYQFQAAGLITDRVVSGSYNASNFNISIPVCKTAVKMFFIQSSEVFCKGGTFNYQFYLLFFPQSTWTLSTFSPLKSGTLWPWWASPPPSPSSLCRSSHSWRVMQENRAFSTSYLSITTFFYNLPPSSLCRSSPWWRRTRRSGCSSSKRVRQTATSMCTGAPHLIITTSTDNGWIVTSTKAQRM